MKKLFTRFFALLLLGSASMQMYANPTGTYNEHDKEALRSFLRQPSAQAGNLNLQRVGLTLADTANWQTDETWISKLTGITWTTTAPKQLQDIPNLWSGKKLAGVLDFSNCTEFVRIGLNNNSITSLNFSNCAKLNTFSCDFNKLTSVNLTGCVSLQTLYCNSNQLSAIDVSACANLQGINAGMNPLVTSLSVAHCANLNKISMEGCGLTSLDVSHNPLLAALYCSNNKLTTLDVTHNPLLTELYCRGNKLTSLDLSHNTALQKLLVNNNLLTSLNLTGVTGPLYQMSCSNNRLKFSDLPLGIAEPDAYGYCPQDTVRGGIIDFNVPINLSSEYLLGGNATVFHWFDVTGGTETPVTLGSTSNGIFNLTIDDRNKTFICKMKNASFPDFDQSPLIYKVAVSGNVPILTITATSGTGGMINPEGTVTVAYAANQTFTFTPNAGYGIFKVYIDGVYDPYALASYTFENVTENHTISVEFEQLTYQIMATAGANGTISPSGSISVAHGEDQTFIFSPNSGYKIMQVLVDGVSNPTAVTDGNYTFTNVTASHALDVQFEAVTYTIVATAGSGGMISPSGNVNVAHGANQTFTISPNTGKVILQVLVDGVNVGAVSSYAFENVIAAHSIEATFQTDAVVSFESPQPRVYPNPTTGECSINNGKNFINKIQVFDAVGRLVYEENYHGKIQKTIDLSTFANGIYFIKIDNKTVRVIKQ